MRIMCVHIWSPLQRLHAQVGNKVLSVAAQDRPSGGGRSSQGGDSGPLQGEAVRSSRSSLSGSHTDLASAASLGGTISAASLGGTFSAPQDIPGAVVGGQEGADLLHPEALFPLAHQVGEEARMIWPLAMPCLLCTVHTFVSLPNSLAQNRDPLHCFRISLRCRLPRAGASPTLTTCSSCSLKRIRPLRMYGRCGDRWRTHTPF